jgi:hypothetical protein
MPPRPRASSESSATPRNPQNGFEKQKANLTTGPRRVSFLACTRDENPTTRPNEFSAAHPKPLFHFTHQIGTDNEDSGHDHVENLERPNDETSVGGSSSGHSSDHHGCREKKKDNVRKYHALMELLTTEVGYLQDLRALVTVSQTH